MSAETRVALRVKCPSFLPDFKCFMLMNSVELQNTKHHENWKSSVIFMRKGVKTTLFFKRKFFPIKWGLWWRSG